MEGVVNIDVIIKYARYNLHGHHSAVIKVLTPCLELSNCTNKQRVAIHNLMYAAHKSLGEYASAHRHVLAALPLFEHKKSKRYAAATHNCACMEIMLKQFDIAERRIALAEALFRQLGAERTENFGVLLISKARLFQERKQYKEALPLLDAAEEILAEFPVGHNFVGLMGEFGNCYRMMGQWADAYTSYTTAVELETLLSGEQSIEYATTVHNLAFAYLDGHQFKNAVTCYQKVVDVYAHLGHAWLKGAQRDLQAAQIAKDRMQCKGGCGKRGIDFCSTECVKSYWLRTGQKDCVRCQYCSEWFATLSVCPASLHKFCSKKACRTKHTAEGH